MEREFSSSVDEKDFASRPKIVKSYIFFGKARSDAETQLSFDTYLGPSALHLYFRQFPACYACPQVFHRV